MMHIEVASSPHEVCPLLLGSTVPQVTLCDADGQQVSLTALTGRKPTVLVFYRGGW